MEALAPGGAAGRREGGPQPKRQQSQRWLEGGGGLDSRQGARAWAKYLLVDLDGLPSAWQASSSPHLHSSSVIYPGVRCCAPQSSNILGGS
jgi:hypothetical protein